MANDFSSVASRVSSSSWTNPTHHRTCRRGLWAPIMSTLFRRKRPRAHIPASTIDLEENKEGAALLEPTRRQFNKANDERHDEPSKKPRGDHPNASPHVLSKDHGSVPPASEPRLQPPSTSSSLSCCSTFADLGLSEPLVATCRSLGFRRPTPVQRSVIPFLLNNTKSHLLALAATGSGKTAAFVLPIVQHLSTDPYGIYAVILTPTRELAKQIHQQVLALGGPAYHVKSTLVVGGLDATKQATELDALLPHFCVATPGRLALLLRGPCPPRLQHARYLVLDEADRLLAPGSGFERDVAELMLHVSGGHGVGGDELGSNSRRRRSGCQTLLFSATMTHSLECVEEMAGAGLGRLPLTKMVVDDGPTNADPSTTSKARASKTTADEESDGDSDSSDDEESYSSSDGDDSDDEDAAAATKGSKTTVPKIPAGLKQQYVFMPSRVRDAYLLATLRALLENGGRQSSASNTRSKKNAAPNKGWALPHNADADNDDDNAAGTGKARSAIVFVSTCERAAFVSELLSQVGVGNVALHSLLSQNRRLASLGKFKSQHVQVLVATDVASRGLDIPTVDLVVNAELPRSAVSYVHRVGRTARAGRRGRAVSLVAESDIGLLHAAERISGRQLEKCDDVKDDDAIKVLGVVAKASRLVKMKLMDIGFDELVQKFKERKMRDKKERERIERALRRTDKKDGSSPRAPLPGPNPE